MEKKTFTLWEMELGGHFSNNFISWQSQTSLSFECLIASCFLGEVQRAIFCSVKAPSERCSGCFTQLGMHSFTCWGLGLFEFACHGLHRCVQQHSLFLILSCLCVIWRLSGRLLFRKREVRWKALVKDWKHEEKQWKYVFGWQCGASGKVI